MATELGWRRISTDSLARHPGRPWRQPPEVVPAHVADHYLSLSVDELLSDVLRHYRVNVWPKVEEIIASYPNDDSGTGVIIEGSALWPEFAIGLDFSSVAALWLTASKGVLTERIYGESLYRSKTGREKMMIDKFLGRTLAYDALMVEVAGRNGLALVDVLQSSTEELRNNYQRYGPLTAGDGLIRIDTQDFATIDYAAIVRRVRGAPGHRQQG